jgi:23S rRNA (pseudouridine1915-N3)-methyltransferase
MTIKIVTVGAKTSESYAAAIEQYTKRMPSNTTVSWLYVKHGTGDPEASKQQEAESILRHINEKSRVILLDETGKQLSSPDLSSIIFKDTRDTSIIIGGAYGVNEAVFKRADIVWSLGLLVFPHQLVRLIIAEQLYRAHTIAIGHPYHHG